MLQAGSVKGLINIRIGNTRDGLPVGFECIYQRGRIKRNFR